MTPPLRRCAASPQWDAALRPAKPDRRRLLAQDTSGAGRPVRGFTLLELMVVVAIMALATAGVSLALRDSSATQLEQEACVCLPCWNRRVRSRAPVVCP